MPQATEAPLRQFRKRRVDHTDDGCRTRHQCSLPSSRDKTAEKAAFTFTRNIVESARSKYQSAEQTTRCALSKRHTRANCPTVRRGSLENVNVNVVVSVESRAPEPVDRPEFVMIYDVFYTPETCFLAMLRRFRHVINDEINPKGNP